MYGFVRDVRLSRSQIPIHEGSVGRLATDPNALPRPHQVARLGVTREGLWLVRQAGGRLRNDRQSLRNSRIRGGRSGGRGRSGRRCRKSSG
eukprot:1194810-Prorocentrum_minimum.AAC.12